MSEHKIRVTWNRTSDDFAYESYDRRHVIRFDGGQTLENSAAPDYLGEAQHANPEELLAASLSSCHMLTFLAVAAKSKIKVKHYEDEATAVLEKNADGKIAVTRVYLRPKIQFDGENQPTPEKIRDLHDKAHKNCMIANSVKCEVIVE